MNEKRKEKWKIIEEQVWDVIIIGAGINGACIYDQLCNRGYKVLLVDKGDFACATSQASAMMAWGGSLYLRNLHFKDVSFFSRARDFMVENMPAFVKPISLRYIARSRIMAAIVRLGFYIYWMIGRFKRSRPFIEMPFKELSFIKNDGICNSLVYEEAMLADSDSRFVLQWITRHQSETNLPMNYCELKSANYDHNEKLWHVELSDSLESGFHKARCKLVINCAGVWAGEINNRIGIEIPHRHVFSKGVLINFKRHSDHTIPLIFETGENGDVVIFAPFGPVSMWGPTETLAESIEQGFVPNSQDIEILLKQASDNLKTPLKLADMISIRCGIRPLVVKKDFDEKNIPLVKLSRNPLFVSDSKYPWISIFGGKITGCIPFSEKVAAEVLKNIKPSDSEKINDSGADYEMETTSFPGMPISVPTIRWCMENELCCTLEDYLRRRTNISQWINREGLGVNNENILHIKKILEQLYPNNKQRVEDELRNYEEKVMDGFDRLVKNAEN